ncbi:MAG: Uncharacterised protein [Owenweeksia sp. TMED14]|nr:MAG: Uncharacterised protein [Owenweeksia sp. TMED14]
MKNLLVLVVASLTLFSCVSQQSASNLSFVDVSLNYDSEDFEIVDLAPITKNAGSLFGITSNDVASAVLDRSTFNVGGGSSFGSATFLLGGVTSFFAASSVAVVNGNDGLIVPFGIIGAAIWGIYNDLLWSNTVKNKAIQRCNYELLVRYPDMDSYINPKYEINYTKGIIGTRCRVTLFAQGVRLKNKSSLKETQKTSQSSVEKTPDISTELNVSEKSFSYRSKVGEMNSVAKNIKTIVPNPEDYIGLSDSEAKEYTRNFKIYFRKYQSISSSYSFAKEDLLINGQDLNDYYKIYLEL